MKGLRVMVNVDVVVVEVFEGRVTSRTVTIVWVASAVTCKSTRDCHTNHAAQRDLTDIALRSFGTGTTV